MTQFRLSILVLLTLLFAFLISCDTEDPFSIEPPDFSTVPEPYDTSGVESVDLQDGVKAYLHEEVYGPFEVTPRDQVAIFMSLWTDDGEIIYSTFSSDRITPVGVSMSLVGEVQFPNTYSILLAYAPGLKTGLLGMKAGERRTIVVPPGQAFQEQNLPEQHPNYQYRNSTLIYDVRISDIGPKKSQ